MNGRADMLAALPGGRLLAEFSLWSADLVRMANEVARVDEYVDIYHADVADGAEGPVLQQRTRRRNLGDPLGEDLRGVLSAEVPRSLEHLLQQRCVHDRGRVRGRFPIY